MFFLGNDDASRLGERLRESIAARQTGGGVLIQNGGPGLTTRPHMARQRRHLLSHPRNGVDQIRRRHRQPVRLSARVDQQHPAARRQRRQRQRRTRITDKNHLYPGRTHQRSECRDRLSGFRRAVLEHDLDPVSPYIAQGIGLLHRVPQRAHLPRADPRGRAGQRQDRAQTNGLGARWSGEQRYGQQRGNQQNRQTHGPRTPVPAGAAHPRSFPRQHRHPREHPSLTLLKPMFIPRW